MFMKTPDEGLRKTLNFDPPEEEEKFTKLAREEFRKSRLADEDLNADSDAASSERTSHKLTGRSKVKPRFFNGHSSDSAPAVESHRSLTNLQNQTFIADKPQPGADIPSATEMTSIATFEPNVTETATSSTSQVPNTTSQVTETTANTKTTSVTSAPITPATTEHEEPTAHTVAPKVVDYSYIDDLLEMSEQMNFDENAAGLMVMTDFVRCVMDVILTDVGLAMDLPIGLLTDRCGNSSDSKVFSAVVEYFAQVYLKQLTELYSSDEISAEDIFGDLEGVSLRSGLASRNDSARTADEPSTASGDRKSPGISGPEDVSTSSDSAAALRDYLLSRISASKRAK